MSSEVDIRIRNLSKAYRIYERPEDRLIQMATLGRVRRFTEFPALTDISLDIRRGETVGIVGRNGCGKSTLLQIICGILQPTSGTVDVKGRIAALLELGAGFNGEFTGRENVYMNGAILGFSRDEMDARFEQIAAFAGIGDFIERPVKTYSSGMFVRLAFAVATAVEPDILVVDEALAVGDEAFQRKCFARIEAIKERGGTVLFVSHAASMIVQLCDRAVLLDGGEKILEGQPKRVTAQYQRLIYASGEAALAVRRSILSLAASTYAATGELPSNERARSGGQAEDARSLAFDNAVTPISGEKLVPAPLDPDTIRISSDRALVDADATIKFDEISFDPNLASQTLINIDSKGARITGQRIVASDGSKVNILRIGRSYTFEFSVEILDDIECIGFEVLFKTVQGMVISGGSTVGIPSARLSKLAGGTGVIISVKFDCLLNPGFYLASCGVWGEWRGEASWQHKIIEGLAFRVEAVPNLSSIGIVMQGSEFTVKFL